MVPGLILKLWKIMMMQLPPILSALCWCERKSNLYLLYDKNWNLRVLRWRDLTVSVQFSTSPGHVSNPALPECLLCQIPHSLSNTRRLPGRGGGMSPLRVERRILQTLNTVRGLYNYHKFCQRPAAYYTKKRVSRWPSKPTYPSIGAREGFKLFYAVPRKISKALVSFSCQCV